jgi:DNA processing protein
MSPSVPFEISALKAMKRYPAELYYRGDLSLLDRPRVSIVGSRKISDYTRTMTFQLAKALAKRGVCIVSGAAMGVDAQAHRGAGVQNTIAVLGNGLDIRYPATNKDLIEEIEENGLLLSQFNEGFRATGWSFVVRNELVVALGDILIVTQAECDSGSMRSVEYAQKMGKEIWVLPQRITESSGTNKLLREGEAKPIYDIEQFAQRFGTAVENEIPRDPFFYFCQKMPTLDETLSRYGDRVYEAELEGIITISNGKVYLN